MIIESLHIDKFAGLSDFDLALGAGLNIIEGRNESGKSTVASFIKFLFYGLSGQKQNGEELSERERCMPFDSSFAGGSAVLISGGKRYVLERRLSVSTSGIRESVRDEVILIDSESGEKVAVGKDAGQVLFGVSSKVFADTAYFRQMADSAPNRSELTEAIGNILFSGEEGTDAKKAMKRLDEMRTTLRHKKGVGGELAELETEISALKGRLGAAEAANRAIIALEGEISERTRKLEMLTSRGENAKKREEAGEICRKLSLRAKKKQHDDAADKARAELADLAPGGKLPTVEDVSVARHTAAELPVKAEAIEAAKRNLRHIEAELEALPGYSEAEAAIERAGGPDQLRELASAWKGKARKRYILGAVFLLLAIPLGAVYALQLVTLPPMAVLGAAGVLALLGALFLIMGAASGSRARKITDLFGRGSSYEAFCDSIERYKRDHSRFCRLTEERAEAEQHVEAAIGELETIERHGHTVLDRLGCNGDAPLAEELARAAEAAEQKRARAAELKAAYLAAKAHADAAGREMGTEGEDELHARLEELGVENADAIDVTAARRETEFYRTQAELQEKEIYSRKISLAENKARAEDPCEIAGKLSEAESAYKKKTRQYNACLKAIEALDTAGQNLRGGVAPYLSEGACRRLSAVTGGKYAGLRVDGELSAVCISKDGIRSLEYLSAGTRDLAYISLRLALIDLLYKREKPPLVFDESFAHQDKVRTAMALRLLSSEGERGVQSLLFTCRNFEAQSAEYGSFTHVVLGRE